MNWLEQFLVVDADLPCGVLVDLTSQAPLFRWVVVRVKTEGGALKYIITASSEFDGPLFLSRDHANQPISAVMDLSPEKFAEVIGEIETESDESGVAQLILDHAVIRLGEDGSVVGISVPDSEIPFARIGLVETNVDSAPEGRYSVVRVSFATDRALEFPLAVGRPQFGSGRSAQGALTYGTCDVTIPRDHRMGQLESPRWWRLEFRQDRKRHVFIANCMIGTEGAFFETFNASENDALIFIHGYNVSFEDGIRRTAQLAYDLGFPGTPILFSWPSQAKAHWYAADEATIAWTEPHFLDFVERLIFSSCNHKVHIIAHSMGSRALSHALKEIATGIARHGSRLGQVIFTAPDIDAGEFSQTAQVFENIDCDRLTMYVSDCDRALLASKLVHKAPRAGEAGGDLLVLGNIDTVDASSVDTSLLGHSYFGERRSVISDIFYIVRHGLPPARRHGLKSQMHGELAYWAFQS